MHVVIGLGTTGLSCVRFLTNRKHSVVVMDTRDAPPNLDKFHQQFPNISVYTGKNWPEEILNQATMLVVSPGVSVALPAIQNAKNHGVEIIGDIELFARHNSAPIVAITGANGKSTVTTLVGEMASFANKKVAVVGNIGTPVLNILEEDAKYELVVMELSSFQLETTSTLKPLAATVLNITPDHLDRYNNNVAEYVKAKHRIFRDAKHVIVNKQDPLSDSQEIAPQTQRIYFTLENPLPGEFGLRQKDNQMWLAYGEEFLLPASALKLVGRHNLANALSALAIGQAIGLPLEAMKQGLQNFAGLAHRCQWVAERNNVLWINDSKGTNIGATQAALKGVGSQLSGKIILILGGESKGADFTDLLAYVNQYCRAIILMGKDALIIKQALKEFSPIFLVNNMQEAVEIANNQAKSLDCILLSPACASLDQYKDYAHRGEVFMAAVKEHIGIHTHVS